ncbi:hypothetical protein T492DRAFT_838797 [Pavlovales sp. CCMP2436]|nr:hypothetical protein T492DRAFT_838797 [Pavlovales sp. CCMP2436]
MLMDPADRTALGRHSAVTSRANGAAAGQAVPAIVKYYAPESAPRSETALRKFVLDHVRRVITSGGGPTAARWDSLDELCLNPGTLHPLILAIAMGASVSATSLTSHLTAATRGPSATLTATTIPTPDPRVPSRATGSMIECRPGRAMGNARSAVSKPSPDHTPRGLLHRPTSLAGISMLAWVLAAHGVTRPGILTG